MMTFSPVLGKVFGAFVLLLNAVLGLLFLMAPTYVESVRPDGITPDSGHNFIAVYRDSSSFPFVSRWDTPSSPSGSDAVVLEDGHPLGPAHSQHAEIRAEGAGRFSFWSGALYFSSSDNSDPRTNGRAYAVRHGTQPNPWLVWSVLILDGLALIGFYGTVLAFLRRRVVWIAATATLLLAGRLAAAAAGLMPPLFEGVASAVDAPLARSIVLHTLLGFGLTAVIFAAGVGVLSGLFGRGPPRGHDLLQRAFLPGLIVAALASLTALSFPHGRLLGYLLCAAAALPLVRQYRDRRSWTLDLRALALCAASAALFSIISGFRFHGPTATLAGAPIGDTTIYVGVANTLVHRLFPLFNLACEGFRLSYANVLPSLIAGALLPYGWFDPYLFFSTSLTLLAVLSAGLLLTLLVATARAQGVPPLKPLDALIFGGLLFGAFRFPSELVNSPPFVFFVPVVFATIYLWMIQAPGGPRLWQAMITAAVGTVLTKVVGFVVLMPLPMPDLVRRLWSGAGRRQLAVAGVFGCIVLVYVIAALTTYLPFFLKMDLLGPRSWSVISNSHGAIDMAVACTLARDIGAVCLAIASTRFRSLGLALGVSAGVLAWLTIPFLFYTSLTAAVLVMALAMIVLPARSLAARILVLLSIVLIIPDTIISEPGGAAVSLAWLAVVGTLVFLATDDGLPGSRAPNTRRRQISLAGAMAAFGAVLLLGAASGTMHAGPDTYLFTPEVRDIWLAVRQQTPSEALIFTDQTGATESRTGGWNDFALAAQRQFYIVSWEVTPLRSNLPLRMEWLSRNEAILAGRLRPEDLHLSRAYDGFYAVIAANRAPPPGATLLYENGSYQLYRLAQHA